MKIAMVAGESNPFVKTGGLGDVVYSLSKELSSRKESVIVILPFYKKIKDNVKYDFEYVTSFPIYMSWRKQDTSAYKTIVDGVTFYFLGNDYYFNRDGIYGYVDDGERFAYFALAARNLFKVIKYNPDIIHCHDWQSAMMPALIKEQNKGDKTFGKTKFVLTIHNPEFKGILAPSSLGDLFGLDDKLYDNGNVRFDGMVSTLKSGIVYADKVTTVSPTHAKELLNNDMSRGLSSVLEYRRFDLLGIVNGIDEGEFDPSHDDFIPRKYGLDDLSKGKKECKKALLKSLNLKDDGGPVYGLVSRLTSQKGIELALHAAREAVSKSGIFLLCGSGEYELERQVESLRGEYPDRVGIYIGYSNKRAHEIYAASDFFLMPSLFEPCGIGQLIAEKYGTLPLARDTGGLHDTIVSYDGKNIDTANGILFRDYNFEGIDYALRISQDIFKDKKLLEKLSRNAAATDNSWSKSVDKYLELYNSIRN